MIDEIWAVFTLIIGFFLWPIVERILFPMIMVRLGWEKKKQIERKG